ncbi:MAG: Uma2 family endonuclease, partial [Planctomycetaceae bacterium]
ECYCVANEPAMRHLGQWDPSAHPPLDLAIEVDITSSSINRQDIYARLGVAELWRFDGERLHSLMLDSGRYVASPESLAVPGLVVNDLLPFLYQMLTERENAILKMFIEWIHETFRPN